MTDDDAVIRRVSKMDESELERLIADRRADTAFIERLRLSIERHRAILDRLRERKS